MLKQLTRAQAIRSKLAQDTVRVLAGRGVRMGVQTAYFVLMARALGPREYGAFIAVLGLAQIAAPFANWGMGNVLVRNVSRDRRLLARGWGNSLVLTALLGSLLLAVLAPLALWLLPTDVPLRLILLIGTAELLFAAAHTTAAQAFQALEQMNRMAQIEIALALTRLAAATLLLTSGTEVTAVVWAQYYLVATIAASLAGVGLVTMWSGRPECDLRSARRDAAEGFYFASGLASTALHNNLGKSLLPRLASLDAAGLYGAASRILDVAFQPLAALIYSSYPRFFREGLRGPGATRAFALRLLPVCSGYAVCSAAVFFLAAPLVPAILGAQYEASASALCWLAVLTLPRTLKYLAADAMTGAGYQRLRTALTTSTTVGHVCLALWLIPLFSWRGAAAAAIVSEGLLAAALWIALARLARTADGQAVSLDTIVGAETARGSGDDRLVGSGEGVIHSGGAVASVTATVPTGAQTDAFQVTPFRSMAWRTSPWRRR
jgi:O-antigen/teichoic acid export membrane protein